MNRNKIHKKHEGITKCGLQAYMRDTKESGLWKDVTCKSCLKIGNRRRRHDI